MASVATRKRSRKLHTVTVCGMMGTGETKSAARADAMSRLEFMARNIRPYFCDVEGWAGICYVGWDGGCICTEYLCTPTEGYRVKRGLGISNESMADAVASLVAHLCDMASVSCDHPAWLQIEDPQARQAKIDEHRYKLAFQAAYNAAPSGLADYRRHEWAIDNAHEFVA